jgi:hypothetical protein
MSTDPDWARRFQFGEMIAALGVIGSLLFVGWEIRQNTAATEGATLQAISDTHTAMLLEGDERFVELLYRVLVTGNTRRDLTPEETLRLQRYYIAFLSHLENTYMQVEAGILDPTVLESYGWRNLLWQTRHFREGREGMLNAGVSAEFADFFRSRTAHLPLVPSDTSSFRP